MLRNTQGLVLHTTKYAESSIIAKIFTRELGLRSYIVKGIRSASGRNKQNLLQPLSHLDMTVYDNPKKQLQYIKEMHPATYHNMASDSVKMALVFFMDEVLYKSLREEEPNPQLFDYVVEQLDELAPQADKAPAMTPPQRHNTLPIRFLLHTSRYLGIEPLDNYSIHEPLFNLKEGRFQAPPSAYAAATNPNIHYFLDAHASSTLHYCLAGVHGHDNMPILTAPQRKNTLTNLLDYYQVHLTDFKRFQSHEVLHAVLG